MAGRKLFATTHQDPLVRRLERAREQLRYSQRKMARVLDIPFRTYQKWIYEGRKPRHGSSIARRAESLLGPRRQNCWEFVRCGRGPGGDRVDSLGPCPASTEVSADGVNGGTNGGRVCWAISGTFCGRQVCGSEAVRFVSCFSCAFFSRVLQDEGMANFKLLKPGQTYTQA